MTIEKNIVISGFMGTGKSTIGKLIAKKLGRKFLDTDVLLEKKFGKTIGEIFSQNGETTFREAEADLCKKLGAESNQVIATGGGTLLPRDNLSAMEQNSSIFCLTARAPTIAKRVQESRERPLLPSDTKDRERTIRSLLLERGHQYRRVFHQIDTEKRSPEDIIAHILDLKTLDEKFINKKTIFVRMPAEKPYPICIAENLLNQLGEILAWLEQPKGPVAIVTNPVVQKLFGDSLREALSSKYEAKFCVMSDGERFKTLVSADQLYQQLIKLGITRDSLIIGLGGGVTLDMAGFVAATYMRGVRMVHIPTTLLAMVDASIGGKTGVDLPQGKNLVGVFKQPDAVIIDPNVLKTLPKDEFACGMAETIKHAIIGDAKLFEMLEKGSFSLENALYRSIRVKVAVVQQDPYEQDGRIALNLGHTFGHAIEKASNYQMRHGHSVAIGLVAAARLSHALGHCDESLPTRIGDVLKAHQLPTQIDGLSPDDIYAAMSSDKKRTQSGLRLLIPKAIGDVRLIDNVEPMAITKSLQ